MNVNNFNIEKKGYIFKFRNPTLNMYNCLNLEYSIPGVKENEDNDGFYYRAEFDSKEKVIRFYDAKIDGKQVNGIALPDAEYETLLNYYNELLEKRKNNFNKIVDEITLGARPINFHTVGCDYPHYQAWLDELGDLKGQENQLMEAAINKITSNSVYVFNSCSFLENALKQPIATKDTLNSKAFNLKFSTENNNIVDRFDMKLEDIIDMKAVEAKIKKDKERKDFADSMTVEILKTNVDKCNEDGDVYAYVKITDKQTSTSLKFVCRNVFDFGYFINPDYEIAPGIRGGISNEGYWQTFKDGEGWVNVRKLTEIEEKALKYLNTFPPIDNDIRL